jgi:hypothetical protein
MKKGNTKKRKEKKYSKRKQKRKYDNTGTN